MNKPFVIVTVIAIVVIALASVGPVVYKAVTHPGIKTTALVIDSHAKPATTSINGTWKVVAGSGRNATQVGFTFHEVLPAERKATSGSTQAVSGLVQVADNHLTHAEITVDATKIRTDIEKRDINVRMKILHTDRYPTATFKTDDSIDLSNLPGDGTTGTIPVTGELTLHGTTNTVRGDFTVLRTGKRILLYGDLPVDRLDYGIKTPEFVAATIAKKGELNIRLDLEKTE